MGRECMCSPQNKIPGHSRMQQIAKEGQRGHNDEEIRTKLNTIIKTFIFGCSVILVLNSKLVFDSRKIWYWYLMYKCKPKSFHYKINKCIYKGVLKNNWLDPLPQIWLNDQTSLLFSTPSYIYYLGKKNLQKHVNYLKLFHNQPYFMCIYKYSSSFNRFELFFIDFIHFYPDFVIKKKLFINRSFLRSKL